MKRHLYPLFLLLWSLPSIAQEESIAVLETRLKIAQDPTERIALLGQMADSAAVTNIQELRRYADEALRLTGDKIPAMWKARANFIAGKAFVHLVNYDSALLFLDRALVLFDAERQVTEMAEAYHWKGYVKANLREFALAAEYYYQAIAIWERTGRRKSLANTYNQLSDMYAMQEEYAKAIGYAKQVIAIFKDIDEPGLQAEALLNLSYIHVLNGDPAGALKYAQEGVRIMERIAPGRLPVARAYIVRGNAHKFLGNYQEAILDYERCRGITQKLGFIRGVTASTANIGHVLLLQKKYAEALPYILQAIENMEERGDTRNLWENFRHAADSYAGLGDYQNAHRYRQLYIEEKEREYEQKIAALQGGLAEKYEAGQRAATIAIQEERIQKQHNFQRLLLGFVALLMLASLLIYLSLRSRQKANRLLNAANNRLEKKNQENELLLREIHHRVKNNLEMVSSLLRLQSRQVNDPDVRKVTEEGQNRVQSIGIVHQKLYQGNNLADIEMRDYFINLSEGILDTFDAENRIQIECIMDQLELDVDTAVPLGLIVNELLTNAIKYAFPDGRRGKVKIQLAAINDECLRLEIADNGIGKTAQIKGTGFGSQLIALLTQQLGGVLQEEVKDGTRLRLEFKKNKGVQWNAA